MAESRNPTRPTLGKQRNPSPDAPKPERTAKHHDPSVPKPVKAPKIHNTSAPKPVEASRIHNPRAQKPEEPTKSDAPKMEKQQSWASLRSLITCKHLQPQPQPRQKQRTKLEENGKGCKKMRCSGSLCNDTRVVQRPELSSSHSPGNTNKKRVSSLTMLSSSSSSINNGNGESGISERPVRGPPSGGASVSSSSSSFMVMPFSRFTGCYECRMVVDPVLGLTRDPSLRATVYTCAQCGKIFMKAENLELHQAVMHAVSELGPEDTSKNIVEIIFQSSWLKKQTPVCKIDRILKIQNTPRTISKFEEYRDLIKARSTKKHPRCLADGNELLRFHSASLLCSLGVNGSSNLCDSIPNCSVCSIIRVGFKASAAGEGILTTATSGTAHDSAAVKEGEEWRAMLVCRVIAGRVKKVPSERDDDVVAEYDSVAGAAGVYANLDELYVFSPRAILPCFVVVYTGF